MCYSVYISTESAEELSLHNSDLVRFERLDADAGSPYAKLLSFPNKWYVGSKSQCSCTFRHLHSVELGFGDPVDWYPEDREEVAATALLYDTLTKMVGAGYRVDLIDIWEGAEADQVATVDVSLKEVPPAAFRLFENRKFCLTP